MLFPPDENGETLSKRPRQYHSIRAMSSTTEQAADANDGAIEREIGHDEYDPIGTLILIMIYFVILAFMWAFMYFVEFLGNGLTVV